MLLKNCVSMPFKTFAAVFRERAIVDERSFGRRVPSFDIYLDIPNVEVHGIWKNSVQWGLAEILRSVSLRMFEALESRM